MVQIKQKLPPNGYSMHLANCWQPELGAAIRQRCQPRNIHTIYA
jgi:hypothetical protein